MNRPGAVPQSLRGMPAGFGGQQQPQQPGRSVSNRLPNGKLANNGSGWAFGGGVPISGPGLQTSSRQLGGNLSFAQSLSGSQPATPLDLSEFPSLSNNSQLPNSSQSSLWSVGGASRNVGGPIPRNQTTPLSAQPGQQDDLFTSSRLSSNQGSFRFGGQGGMGSAAQPQPSSIDDFPPLSNNGFRNANGEIGQERSANLMSSLGFSPQDSTSPGASHGSRSANGLLNALSATNRASEARSPDGSAALGAESFTLLRPIGGRLETDEITGSSRPQGSRGIGNDEPRQKPPGFREGSVASQLSGQDAAQAAEGRSLLGVIGNEGSVEKTKEEGEDQSSIAHDPLAGMAPIDKWGIKGLRTLINNYPDYNAAITGIDPSVLGLSLTSPEPISTQIYSLFNELPPRPAIPHFHLPECYKVNNVQPLENKLSSFNEETLMWIFYSCPGDIKQHWAAQELNNRNWRWHKKLQIWLTKDDVMAPRILSAHHEQGYYIIWDTVNWRKDRRELLLHYADLDTPQGNPA